VVVAAAVVVVVAPLERYRHVDFANRVFDFANRGCRLGLVAPARFPFVLRLGVVVGLAGVAAAVAAVERYHEVDFVRQAKIVVSRLAMALPVCLPARLVPVVVCRVADVAVVAAAQERSRQVDFAVQVVGEDRRGPA